MFMLGKELGVEDEFNLCNGDVEAVISYAVEIENQIIKPALEVNFNYHNMSEHMLQGASQIVPFIDPTAFKAWIYNIYGACLRVDFQDSPISSYLEPCLG